ncbi:bifunctional DNA primase/polymerase [Ferrimicrobium sp.]|uniref:bifunctional DNA primase/polymerase n=1 Tax=Ferrimicrobium sp. TaxID=2926050 RepID=UPI00260F3122|nr:bifunctional DNA primase/polymerase [Ferrimicrobium sp.]
MSMQLTKTGLENIIVTQEYAARGWATYPLAPGSKKPLKGSHGFHDATTDQSALLDAFSDPPDLNIGIRTGETSGIVVIDIDAHEGAANGYDSMRALASQGFRFPTGNRRTGCAIAKTPSGGLHLYYAAPLEAKIKSTSGVLAPGLDTRGEGGYIVAPPSATDKGSYVWKQCPDTLLELPGWVIERCKVTPAPERPRVEPTKTIPPAVAQMLRDRLDRIAQASNGQRNATLNREAFYLAQYVGKGFDEDQLTEWLRHAALKAEMPEYEAQRTIRSALDRAPISRASDSQPQAANRDSHCATPTIASTSQTTLPVRHATERSSHTQAPKSPADSTSEEAHGGYRHRLR